MVARRPRARAASERLSVVSGGGGAGMLVVCVVVMFVGGGKGGDAEANGCDMTGVEL